MGRKKSPFYHIVIADSRSPRDGRFIERIGSYNPMTKPATIDIDRDKAFEWLNNGAQPTDTVNAILRFKGVLYKKHLMRGVKKGALTIEQANEKHTSWHTFENSLAAGDFAPITSQTLYPRRSAFSTRFKNSSEELSEWENSIRAAI